MTAQDRNQTMYEPDRKRRHMSSETVDQVAPPATTFEALAAEQAAAPEPVEHQVVFQVDDLDVHYGDHRAVRDVAMSVHRHEITAFIGPSGCGKTTVLRCFNRMNDL